MQAKRSREKKNVGGKSEPAERPPEQSGLVRGLLGRVDRKLNEMVCAACGYSDGE